MKINYEETQLSAGKNVNSQDSLWHTDINGKYWLGDGYHRTPKQLLEECRSVIADLIVNHPELIK